MIEGDLDIQWKNRRDQRSPRTFGLTFEPYLKQRDCGRKEYEVFGDAALGGYLRSIGIGSPERILGILGMEQQRLTLGNVVLDDTHARRYLV